VDLARRLDPVHSPFQVDVHEHEIRAQLAGLLHGLLAARNRRGHPVAQGLELRFQVEGDDPLVLDDQNARWVQRLSPTGREAKLETRPRPRPDPQAPMHLVHEQRHELQAE
jgi:hypothetical protein